MDKPTTLLLILVLFVAACSGPAEAPVAPVESARTQPADPATATVASTTAPRPTSMPEPAPVEQAGPPPTATPVIELAAPVAYDGQPLPKQEGYLYSASGAYAVCHSEMVDEAGTECAVGCQPDHVSDRIVET